MTTRGSGLTNALDTHRPLPAGDRGKNGELWGFALTPERREPLAERGMRSEVLELWAYVAERTPPAAPDETWALTMRWHDPQTAPLPDYDQAQAKIAKLEQQLRQLRGGR